MTLTNLTTTPVDEKLLERITGETLKAIKRSGEVSVVLVGAGRMQQLNRRYRGKNRVTDVLAFPYGETQRASREKLLGEVVICLPVAKKQAKRAGHSFEYELATLLVHGILHGCGYDHERSEKDAEVMFGLQKKILNNFQFPSNQSPNKFQFPNH